MVTLKQRRTIIRVVILVACIVIWMKIPDYLDHLLLLISGKQFTLLGLASLVMTFAILYLSGDLFYQVAKLDPKKEKSSKESNIQGIDVESLIPITIIPKALLSDDDSQDNRESKLNPGFDKMNPIVVRQDHKIKSIMKDNADPSQFYAPVPTSEEASEEEGIVERNIHKIAEENFDAESNSLVNEILGVSFNDPDAKTENVHEGVEVLEKTRENIEQYGIEELDALG